MFRTGYPAAEPTLGLTGSGAIFYQATKFTAGPQDGPPQPFVLRSSDGGLSWQDVSPRLPTGQRTHQESNDPYLYVDKRTSRVFTVDDLVPGACSLLSFSSDEGTSWQNTLAGCEEWDHETVFAGPPSTTRPLGYPDVVYYCAAAAGATNLSAATECDKSLNGGRTFAATGLPAFTDDPRQPNGDFGVAGLCEGLSGHGFVGRDGTVYLPKGWCGTPYLAISNNEGLTWRRVKVSDLGMVIDPDATREHEGNVAVDAHGNIFYLWIARDHLPHLAISRDGGRSFGKPMMIAPPGVVETDLPMIDIGPHGGIEMVYMGSTNAPGPPFPEQESCLPTVKHPTRPVDCLSAQISNPAVDQHYHNSTWNGYITVSGDPLATNPLFYSTSVNDPNDPLIRGACLGRCAEEFDFLGVFADRDGAPWAAYVDGCETTCITSGSDNADEGIVGKLEDGPVL